MRAIGKRNDSYPSTRIYSIDWKEKFATYVVTLLVTYMYLVYH